MGQYDRRGIVQKGAFNHLTRIHTGRIESAPEKLLETDNTVSRIEKQTGKDFMGKVAHRGVQVTASVLRITQGISSVELLLKVTPPELPMTAMRKIPCRH